MRNLPRRRWGAAALAVALVAATLAFSPAHATSGGILVSPAELATRPMSGAAWDAVRAAATGSWGTPDLCNQDATHGPLTLAGALVAARAGDAALAGRVRSAIDAAVATQRDGCTNAVLSLGRQLPNYVIAADLVGHRSPSFVGWVDAIRTREVGGHARWTQLDATCGDSSNNWGAEACAAVTAAHAFLGDGAGLAVQWARFRGFTGDRAAWVFPVPRIAQPSWLCTPTTAWTPIERCPGDVRDGAPTEDAWRAGAYPTISNTYVMDALGTLALGAEILSRAGYDAWPLLEPTLAFTTRFPSTWTTLGGRGGRTLAFLVNHATGSTLPATNVGNRIAWGFGWLDWAFGPGSASAPTASPTPAPPATATPGPSATAPAPSASPKPTPSPTPAPTATAAPSTSPAPSPTCRPHPKHPDKCQGE